MAKQKQEFASENTPKERTVEVYSTSGTCQATFKTSAQTFGELKKQLSEKSVNYQNMKAIIGENQEELTEDSQLLLETDFTLFLTPVAVKSGV